MPIAEVADRWRLLARAVLAIDRALRNPLAAGAAAILLTAESLDAETEQLCSFVRTTGEAISCRGNARQLELLRKYGVTD